MTLTHEFCPYQFNHGKCGCSCHTAPEKKRARPKKVESVTTTEITVDETEKPVDPRPWKR